jgi:hypothetical protein
VSQIPITGSFHGRESPGQQFISRWHPIETERDLTAARDSVQDGVRRLMKASEKFVGYFCIVACLLAPSFAAAQNPPAAASKPQPPPSRTEIQTRITIEVKGGDGDTPVENASVYVKFIEERKLKKDKKLELNVKTNRDGVAHVPDAPLGRVLIQVVAEGWKTYGRWFDITEPTQTIKVHLERPPKWY